MVFRGLTAGLLVAFMLCIGLAGWALYSGHLAERSESVAKESKKKATTFGEWAKEEAQQKSQSTAQMYSEKGITSSSTFSLNEALHYFSSAVQADEAEILDPDKQNQAAELKKYQDPIPSWVGSPAAAKDRRGASKPDSSHRVRLGLTEPSYYLDGISAIDDFTPQPHSRLVRRLNAIPSAALAFRRLQDRNDLWKTSDGTNPFEMVTYESHMMWLREKDVLVKSVKDFQAEIDRVLAAPRRRANDSSKRISIEPPMPIQVPPPLYLPHQATTAAFSLDGAKIVTAGYDGDAVIWSSTDGMELLRLKHEKGTLYWADFDSTGNHVVAAGSNGIATIWDLSVDPPIRKDLSGHTGDIRVAEFSDDNRFVVTIADDGTTRVWSTSDCKEYRSFESGMRDAVFAAINSDGTKVLSVSSRTAKVWSIEENRLLAELGPHGDVLSGAKVSRTFDEIETRSWDNEARIWKSRETAVSQVHLVPHEGSDDREITHDCVFISTDSGGRFLTGKTDLLNENGSLHVWNSTSSFSDMVPEFSLSQDVLDRLSSNRSIQGVAVSPRLDRIVIRADSQFLTYVRSGEEWEREPLIRQVGFTSGQNDPVISSNLKWLVYQNDSCIEAIPLTDTGDREHPHILFDPNASAGITNIRLTECFSLSSEAGLLAVVNSGKDDRRRVCLQKVDPVSLLSADGESPVFLDGSHNDFVSSCRIHNRPLVGQEADAETPRAPFVVTASRDGMAKLWDTGKPSEDPVVFPHPDPVEDAIVSPDGKIVATGARDNLARLWDIESQTVITAFKHPGRVLKVAFLAKQNQQWLLTACSDGRFRLWPISAIEGDGKYLTLWAEILTGTQMREAEFRALTSNEWEERKLRSLKFRNLMPPLPVEERMVR